MWPLRASIRRTSSPLGGRAFSPSRTTLPFCLDVGTDTESYHTNPHYLGIRQKRVSNEEYYEFVDEFCMAVKDKCASRPLDARIRILTSAGPTALLQFEDFSNNHCFDLLERYRNRLRCFNDDIQGTGAVIAAGFITAVKVTGVPYSEQRIGPPCRCWLSGDHSSQSSSVRAQQELASPTRWSPLCARRTRALRPRLHAHAFTLSTPKAS